MRLSLSNDLEEYIQRQISAGNFPSPEAVVEDALRRVMAEAEMELTDEDVAAIKQSDSELARGEGITADEVRTRIRGLYGKAQG